MKTTGPHISIMNKCREMILLMNIHLNHFPRHEKYGLCQQIREAAYDVYGLLIEGQRKYHNKTTLTNLDIRHEQLRMFVNLAFEMGYYDYQDKKRDRSPAEAERRYTALSILVSELGAMIGGWIRRVKAADGVVVQHV